MRPLSTKLLRDLWRLRAQALAIALVTAAGIGMVVMSYGMINSLQSSRALYYADYRLADVFVPVRRAPESLMQRIRAVPGVAGAQSRISAGALLDLPGIAEPVTARIHSLPAGAAALNRLVLREGRLPASGRGEEVVVSEAFARASRLSLGDRFEGLVNGRQMGFRLVGTALSPEYVYAVAPGQIFPDNRRFGIVWMEREPLAAAFDLTGAFNEALVRLGPGVAAEEVVRRLDLLVAAYGTPGAYARSELVSDRFVSNEIDQLATTVQILPPIFLIVAAFLLNIVLGRLVDTEREAIGLLKAFGYRSAPIMRHYIALALLLTLGGLLLGGFLGAWLGHALATLYQQFFVFPVLRFQAGPGPYLAAAAAALAATGLGAFAAVRRAARLMPADAMRPPVPHDYSSRIVVALSRAAPDEPSRIILRNMLRQPIRSLLTVAGLAAALALYIASASATDNVDRMIAIAFDRAEREDLVVTFVEPRDARAIRALEALPGVIRVEPFRATAARLVAGPASVREGLTGRDTGADLSRLADIDGRIVEPPPGGTVISSRLAARLGVGPGDEIEARITEGARGNVQIRVAAVVDTPLGSAAQFDRRHLNRLLREGNIVSGAYLSVDEKQLDAVYAALKRTPLVAGVSLRDAMLRGIRETVAENMGIVTLFNTGFAALIVLGVVYNSARISLSERARDLASLRVLGFRRPEVAFILLGEQAVLLLLSLLPGLGLGIALSRYITARFSADLYTIPFGMSAATLAEGVLVVALAAGVTALLVRNRVNRLDLIQALKTRE